ncbi:MAG TPA: ribosome silencing factor [Hyphomicrobiales bacterium]|nr:ribosome silencing factor [Hyphomicrobiales bacterium]
MTSAKEGAGKGAPQNKRARRQRSARPQLLETIIQSLDGSKAEETVTIPLLGKSSIGDHMVVSSGRSQRHVAAVAERLLSDLKTAGFGRARAEGIRSGDWVLIDAGDVIVHIFRPEVREFYNLEKMWSAEQPKEQAAS